MAVEDSVAHDQLRAFIERIERMEEEKAAIAADIKEIYAEAKGNGFDTKILRKIVTIRKQDANERAEQEAVLDLYMGALGMAPMPHADFDADEQGPDLSGIDPDLLVTLIEGSKTEAGRKIIMAALETVKSGGKADPRLAALRADPAMSIVDPSNLKSKSNMQDVHSAPSNTQHAPAAQTVPDNDPVVTSPVESDAVEISTTIQPETANQAETEGALVDPCTDEHGDGNGLRLKGNATLAAPGVGIRQDGALAADRPITQREDDASPQPSLPKYAEPGVITWETTPPEGVERGVISMAFGNMGQDTAVIADDLEKGRAQPIVKKGKIILDGWARFMAARGMTELDGSPMAYPVVQYDGSDILVDIIKLNVDGRILTEQQKRLIAANLARQEPARKDDIYHAFELWMEPV